ncbi:hypothetical protein ACH41H_02545 [Streptomyces sp. NPDC020800]|uniref:hypothetical protein n=1 Tax=Streptomyces sp. NPDC020800 TaxID=3365092 RepID=UPI0037925832
MPMPPVIAGNAVVGKQIVIYSWAMVPASLTLWWPLGATGWLCPVASTLLFALVAVDPFVH